MKPGPALGSAAVAGVALLMFVPGCVIIPTAEFDSGRARVNFNKQSPAQLRPGVTTMEDVLLRFGEPDAVSSDERKLAYRSEKVVGVWILGGGSGGEMDETITKDRYLLVEFDENAVVRNRKLSAQRFFPVTPDMMFETKGQADASPGSMDESATISGQIFWFPNTEGFKKFSLEPGHYSRGYLALTASALQFRDLAQLGNTPPQWLLPYEMLTECRIAKFGWGRRVVIRTRDNQVHSFNFMRGAFDDKKKSEAAGRFIQTQIDSGEPRPQIRIETRLR